MWKLWAELTSSSVKHTEGNVPLCQRGRAPCWQHWRHHQAGRRCQYETLSAPVTSSKSCTVSSCHKWQPSRTKGRNTRTTSQHTTLMQNTHCMHIWQHIMSLSWGSTAVASLWDQTGNWSHFVNLHCGYVLFPVVFSVCYPSHITILTITG